MICRSKVTGQGVDCVSKGSIIAPRHVPGRGGTDPQPEGFGPGVSPYSSVMDTASKHFPPEPPNSEVLRCPSCRASIAARSGGETCEHCGYAIETIQGVPVLFRDPEQIRQILDEARNSPRAPWYEDPHDNQWSGPYRHHLLKRRAYVEDVLARSASGGRFKRGLDLGCGDGSNAFWISRFTEDLWGADYNSYRLTRALDRFSSLFLADVTDMPVADGAFDMIYFNHVLEHVPDDAAALSEIARILAPGGVVILGTPNEGVAFWRLAYALQPSIRKQTDHVNFYTADSLGTLCEEAGLSIMEITHIGWGVPHWRLDALLRRFRWVDDLFEVIGKRFFPRQATSLYAVLTK